MIIGITAAHGKPFFEHLFDRFKIFVDVNGFDGVFAVIVFTIYVKFVPANVIPLADGLLPRPSLCFVSSAGGH